VSEPEIPSWEYPSACACELLGTSPPFCPIREALFSHALLENIRIPIAWK
jgi:hypothetical protein